MADTRAPDLTMLMHLVERVSLEQRQQRQAMDTIMRAALRHDERLGVIENRVAGVDKQITDLRDDLVLTMKMELLGQLAQMQTALERTVTEAVEQAITRNGKADD